MAAPKYHCRTFTEDEIIEIQQDTSVSDPTAKAGGLACQAPKLISPPGSGLTGSRSHGMHIGTLEGPFQFQTLRSVVTQRDGVQIAVRQTTKGTPWRTRARKTLPHTGEALSRAKENTACHRSWWWTRSGDRSIRSIRAMPVGSC